MSITKKDIKEIELIGKSQDGCDVYHVAGKGGLHQILKKKKKGDFQILGQGNHRGVARVLANQIEKNINWSESMFKSEDADFIKQYEKDNKLVPDSNMSNHLAQAVWHSHLQTAGNAIGKLYHGLQALAHCQAAGLDKSKSLEVINNTLKKLNKSYTMDQPFDEELLRFAYEKKTGKPFPTGE